MQWPFRSLKLPCDSAVRRVRVLSLLKPMPPGSYTMRLSSLLIRPKMMLVVPNTASRLRSSASSLWWPSAASLSKGDGACVEEGLQPSVVSSPLSCVAPSRVLSLLTPPGSYATFSSLPLLSASASSSCAEVSSMSPLKASLTRSYARLWLLRSLLLPGLSSLSSSESSSSLSGRERRLLLLLSLVSRRSCICGGFVIGAVSYFSIFETCSCSCARRLCTLISDRQG